MSNPIKSKCVICTLRISQWGANKQDKTATAKLAADEKADAKRIRVVKKLVDPNLLKTIGNLIQSARKYRLDHSMCWGDGGERILAVSNLADYQDKMIVMKDAIDVAVQSLVDCYTDAQKQAEVDLGGTYKASDYPSVGQLRQQYDFVSRIAPVTDNGLDDVRLEGYSKEEMDDVRKAMGETKTHQVQSAIDDCKSRLQVYLGHFCERLKNQDSKLRESLTNNLRDLLDLLQGFASMDQELKKQIVDARKLLIDTDVLRHNPQVRADTQTQAANILAAFK